VRSYAHTQLVCVCVSRAGLLKPRRTVASAVKVTPLSPDEEDQHDHRNDPGGGGYYPRFIHGKSSVLAGTDQEI